MDRAVSPGQVFRFGQFEADVARSTLTRKGVRVKIHDQPFRVLTLLLENAGEIVTREELRQKLWPEGTYVDFDGSLNVILKKLRATIGDDSDNPRFIETLPRRGYRFIASVSDVSFSQAKPAATAEVAAETDSLDSAGQHTAESGQLPVQYGSDSFLSRISTRSKKLAALSAVSVLLILAIVVYRVRPHARSDSTPQKRIMLAILPFQNLSNDPAQEYFSDGLTEETITDLGELSPQRMGVIARTSAMAYKHTNKTVSQIGQELGVDYILEGSVRRAGDQARISAQLIRVKDQTHLWARNYDRDVKDLINVQDDLGKAIAAQVQANLTPQRESEPSGAHTLNSEAYDLYLKGRFYWNQRTPEAVKESIQLFQQAIGKDPNFALAYSGLADAYNIATVMGNYSAKEILPLAKAAAEKAIQLDPFLAEPHAALGMAIAHYDFDFPKAEKEFLKALALNPNSSYAHLFYSNCYLMPVGRVQEAIDENKKALELDPLSLPINNFMGMTYMFAGQYQNSYDQFQHTIQMDPTFPLAHYYFAYLLFAMDRYEQGIQEDEKAALLAGSTPEVASAEAAQGLRAFKSGGPTAFWRRYLENRLRTFRRGGSVSASELAAAYALAGDKDEAFEWLNKAYEEHDGQDITLVKVDFGFQNLRGDPRFAAFVHRIGLPE